jgi:hypothetical protein
MQLADQTRNSVNGTDLLRKGVTIQRQLQGLGKIRQCHLSGQNGCLPHFYFCVAVVGLNGIDNTIQAGLCAGILQDADVKAIINPVW